MKVLHCAALISNAVEICNRIMFDFYQGLPAIPVLPISPPPFSSLLLPSPSFSEDFGFRHLLWVYSGRRGIHCWVCDQEAIQLSQDARVAIVEYLTLVRGGEQQQQKVKLKKPPYHPSIK